MEKDFTPSFTDLRRDADRYADLTCEKGEILGAPAIFGYDEAEDAVFRAYLEAEAYDAVIHFLLTERSYEWGLNDRFLQVSDILRGRRHAARLNRMWRAAIATQKQFFRENVAYRDLPDMEKTIAQDQGRGARYHGTVRRHPGGSGTGRGARPPARRDRGPSARIAARSRPASPTHAP